MIKIKTFSLLCLPVLFLWKNSTGILKWWLKTFPMIFFTYIVVCVKYYSSINKLQKFCHKNQHAGNKYSAL